jgi:integrase
MATAKITTKSIAKLQLGARITDSEMRGFIARRLPSGKVSFGYQYVAPTSGERRWISIGLLGEVTAEEARTQAKRYAGQRAGLRDPVSEHKAARARSENTVDHVLDKFLEIYVPQKRLRSAAAMAAAFAKHVRPMIGGEVIYDLDRADITRILDKIADDHPRMADVTLAYLRKAFNWWQTRDGKFKTPIVIGMARTSIKDYSRDRILAADEIADIFLALAELELGTDVPECYPAFIRTLLLTGCRRSEVSEMHTREFENGSWTIPKQRYKTKIDHLVPLVPAVKKILPERKFGFVFSSDEGKTSFSGYSKAKAALDKKIAEIRKREQRPAMAEWRLHDLRRTARTLMAAAGVADNIGERCLGHVITGVHGVYNRFDYRDEKADALTRLAAHVDGIVNPRPNVVVPIRKRAKRAASSPA